MNKAQQDKTTLTEIDTLLRPFVPLVAQTSGKDITLQRMFPLLKAVGNPHENLRIIHVAGTSGKTSTCYFLSALLTAAGKKTGLTVSPHIDGVNERVQINGKPLTPNDFKKRLQKFLQLIEVLPQLPSYFELIMAFALWVFAEEGVDYAVIETGMGGLFDASNVADRSDKVCVITDIGYDHMHLLGSTLPEITAQKAGIIHKHNQVFTHQQTPDSMKVIQTKAQNKQATLKIIKHSDKNTADDFQKRNWLLAYTVARYIAQRDKFQLKEIDHQSLVIPARMQIIKYGNSSLILDGAHNQQKMAAFVRSVQQAYPNQKAVVLLALKKGKEYQAVINELQPITEKLIVSTFSTSQDLPAVSQDPQKIVDFARAQGIEAHTYEVLDKALEVFLSQTQEPKIITGSFYFIGQVRQLLF